MLIPQSFRNRIIRFSLLRIVYKSAATFGVLWTLVEAIGAFGIVELRSGGWRGPVLGLAVPSLFVALLLEIFATRLQTVIICQFTRTLSYLPLYVAIHRGFFQREGLRISVIDGGGDSLTWNKVAMGDAQFGVSDPVGMIKDTATAGVVIATVVGKPAIWGMSRKPMIPIRSMDRLHNKKVSVFSAPSTTHTLITNALREGVGTNQSQIVEHKPGSEMGRLDDDTIDIVCMPEPQATMAEKKNAVRVLSAPKIFGAFLCTGCFTSKKYALENPRIVQAVVNALERAVRFIREDHLGTLEVVHHEFADLDRTKVELATLRLLDDGVFPESVTVDQAAWHAAVKAWFPATWQNYDFEDSVDNRFATTAHQILAASP